MDVEERQGIAVVEAGTREGKVVSTPMGTKPYWLKQLGSESCRWAAAAARMPRPAEARGEEAARADVAAAKAGRGEALATAKGTAAAGATTAATTAATAMTDEAGWAAAARAEEAKAAVARAVDAEDAAEAKAGREAAADTAHKRLGKYFGRLLHCAPLWCQLVTPHSVAGGPVVCIPTWAIWGIRFTTTP